MSRQEFQLFTPITVIWLAGSAVADVLITLMLVFYLVSHGQLSIESQDTHSLFSSASTRRGTRTLMMCVSLASRCNLSDPDPALDCRSYYPTCVLFVGVSFNTELLV